MSCLALKDIVVKKNEVLPYISFMLLNLYYGFSDTVLYSGYMIIILLTSMMLSCVYIFLRNKYNKTNLIVLAILMAIFIYNYIVSKDSRILALILTVISLKNLDIRKLLRFMLYEKIIITFFVIASSFVVSAGIYESRAVLGYTHGNLMMLNLMDIMLLYLCVYWKKINFYKLLIMIGIILMCFLITESRTGLILSLAIWLLVVGLKYFKFNNILNMLAKFLPFILMALSIYLPLCFRYGQLIGNNPAIKRIISSIDTMLSSRLTIANVILGHTDIGLISSKTNYEDLKLYKYLVVDSGYVQLLLVFGILGSLLFLIFHYFMVKELIKREKGIYIVAVVAMALYAFTENSFCSLKYNFTLLFFIFLLQKRSYLNNKLILKIVNTIES